MEVAQTTLLSVRGSGKLGTGEHARRLSERLCSRDMQYCDRVVEEG